MTELELKYGCNPNQKPARIFMEQGELPLKVLNGKPGYINFMDALNSWQLVKALKQATGLSAAASFKHVSPAGAALGLPLTDVERKIYFAPEGDLSPIACAYIRARGADRLCSFGDWAALSDTCDADTARFLALEVSDGVIAPGYTDEALEILKTKRKGGYNVVEIDPEYTPAPLERRNIFGITFEQGYNDLKIDESMLQNIVTKNKELSQQAKHDMMLALITLKYTQSNSDSRAASTAPVWPATRRTSGGCASTPRSWAWSSWTISAAPTGTTPSICISPTSTRMCWPTGCGRPSSSTSPRC